MTRGRSLGRRGAIGAGTAASGVSSIDLPSGTKSKRLRRDRHRGRRIATARRLMMRGGRVGMRSRRVWRWGVACVVSRCTTVGGGMVRRRLLIVMVVRGCGSGAGVGGALLIRSGRRMVGRWGIATLRSSRAIL